MQPKHYVALALVVGLVIGIGGWLVLSPKQALAPQTATSTATGAAASTTTTGGVSIQTTGGQATVGEVSTAAKPPATPALVFSADLSADAKTALQTQYHTLTTQLKTSPTRVDLWLELGVVYKIAGQYDAAVAVWTYVAHNGPNSINYIAYGNLGDLYLNFTHQYPQAVAAYKAALSVQPNNADYQAGLKAAQQLAK